MRRRSTTTTAESGEKCPQYYKIGDKVEAIKLNIGAWFSADVIDIHPKPTCECYGTCRCLFKVLFESEDDKAEIGERKLDEIRQVTYSSIEWDSLEKGMKVVINYNIKTPGQWGYWYDYIINDISKRDGITYAKGTLMVGYNGVTDKIPIEICSEDTNEILEIRPHATVSEKELDSYETGVKPEYCKSCKNKPKSKCRKCCCCKCGMKKDFNLTVLCDECADWYHIYCVNPPLSELPNDDDDWYCPKCNNELLREKKEMRLKAKMQKKKKDKGLRMMRAMKDDLVEKKTVRQTRAKGAVARMKPSTPDASVPDMKVNTMKSEIPKNSAIWNDVEKLFPHYRVVHISVDLAEKSGDGTTTTHHRQEQEVEQPILSPTLERLIYGDEINEHLWTEARKTLKNGREAFLAHVRKLFTCSICCDIMREPITLSCKHSFCITCFFKTLSVNVYNCALCRTDVIHTEHYLVNENLTKILELLFRK